MKIYIYDDKSFQFIKSTYALLDIEKSKQANEHIYTIPKNCTTIEPPKCGDNESCFFINDTWVVEKDYRGKKFFDTKLNKTVIIDYLGEVPEHLISITDSKLINYICSVDYEKLYTSIYNRIENLFLLKMSKPILIGKYNFYATDISNYLNTYKDVTNKINNINKEIDAIEKSIQTQQNVEKINELKQQQLDKLKNINNITITLSVLNKMNKAIDISINYQEFHNIIDTIQKYITDISIEKKNSLIKINKLSNYELILFEQRLIKEELNYGDTEIKENPQTNS